MSEGTTDEEVHMWLREEVAVAISPNPLPFYPRNRWVGALTVSGNTYLGFALHNVYRYAIPLWQLRMASPEKVIPWLPSSHLSATRTSLVAVDHDDDRYQSDDEGAHATKEPTTCRLNTTADVETKMHDHGEDLRQANQDVSTWARNQPRGALAI